jgi:hypothetical protein
MKIETFVARYRLLYHMAERGSWGSIQKHGLLSSSAILDLLDIPTRDRHRYERIHRPEKTTLRDPKLGTFVLRDQKPMNDERLAWCLQDRLKPSDWYGILNSKIFFWVSEERLRIMLGARAYRDEEHDVLTIDTEPLIRAHHRNVRLTHMNTGNTFPYPANRGHNTFKTIEEYPTRRDGITPSPEVVELVVEGGITDIASYVLRVDQMKGPHIARSIYMRA